MKEKSTPVDPRQFIALLALILSFTLFLIENLHIIPTLTRDIGFLSILAVTSFIHIYYSIKTGKIPFRGPIYDAKDQPYLFRIALITFIAILTFSIYGVIFLIISNDV